MTDYKCRDEAVGEKIAKFLQWDERKHVTSKLEDVNGSDQRDGCSSHTSDTSHLCQNPEICCQKSKNEMDIARKPLRHVCCKNETVHSYQSQKLDSNRSKTKVKTLEKRRPKLLNEYLKKSGQLTEDNILQPKCYSSVIWNAEFDIPRDLRPNSKVRPQPGFDWTSDAWNLTPVSLSAGQQNCATVTVPNFHDSTGNRFKHCSERPHIVLGIGQQQK